MWKVKEKFDKLSDNLSPRRRGNESISKEDGDEKPEEKKEESSSSRRRWTMGGKDKQDKLTKPAKNNKDIETRRKELMKKLEAQKKQDDQDQLGPVRRGRAYTEGAQYINSKKHVENKRTQLIKNLEDMRRKNLGTDRSSSFPSHYQASRTAMLYKDKLTGNQQIFQLNVYFKLILLPVSLFFSGKIHVESVVDEEKAFFRLFTNSKCYDLIPNSSKLIVLDVNLPVKEAFLALVENNIRAAPLWSSKTEKFVNILTISDFIKILHR